MRSDEEWVFGVKDHGIGIDPGYAQQIFAPFKKLHGLAEYDGSGIGLAICRRVVGLHGGTIWVTSAPSGGAHFQFKLAPERVRAEEEEPWTATAPR